MSSARTRRTRGRREDAGLVTGRRAVAEAIDSGRASEVLVARTSKPTQGLRAVVVAARRGSVPIREVDRSELDDLSDDHQGVVARVGPRETLSERELSTFPFEEDAIVVALDGVSDPQNLGAAARSAEAAGACLLVSRVHRGAPVTSAAIRASAGALEHLSHARVANIARALGRLQEAGFTVVGLDGAAPSTVFDEPCPPGRIAIVVGSEGKGMSRLVRERCDLLVSLPMHGRIGSLNASASLAAVLYAFVLRSREPGRG